MAQDKDQGNVFVNWMIALLVFVTFGVGAVLLVIVTFPYQIIREPLVEGLRLEVASSYWLRWRWILNPIRWAAAGFTLLCLAKAITHFAHASHSGLYVLAGLGYVFLTIVFSFVYIVLQWMRELHDDPEAQRKAAGYRAEKTVAKLIDAAVAASSDDWQALHGSLLVFHPGTDREFSVELDHLLVTPWRIYLVETKYKSGTICVEASAAQWSTSSVHGPGSMRNALLQVKNSARVLRWELDLPEIVPIVAILGHETTLVGAPGNVVLGDDVITAIQAFEQTAQGEPVPVAEVMAKIRRYLSDDFAAMDRHKARAKSAQWRVEADRIVQTASID